ncbi:MAG: carbohydrate kinase [Rhodobacteraceae bacterium]|nr:carbohydrate kinase [Paracoccaceae bacterium]
MSAERYVIGLDGGTGGARALVADLSGNVRAIASSDYATTHPHSGWAEQDPADWWRAACTAVAKAIRMADVSPRQIAAICADGTSSTLVALDAGLQPTMPAILWMDNRASPQARRMAATGDAALRRSRIGVSSEWAIPKILWLRETRPEVFDRSRWFVEMADYLALRLSGALSLGLNHITNRWFYDGRRGGWPEDFFARIGLSGITERFPARVLPLGAPVGPIAPEAAAEMGLDPATLVVCGGTDAYVAMLGLDVCAAGRTAFITGSSHLVLSMTDRDLEVPGIFGPHPDCVVPDLYVMEGGQVSTGSVIRWWHDQVGCHLHGEDSFAAMMRAAEAIPIGAEGLVALDFWQGNRNPYIDYDLQGALWGMTLKHTPAHILRALLESVVYGTRNILVTMAERGVAVEEMVGCGGATRSPFWMQMHADAAGVPISVPVEAEATAMGAAVAAAHGVGAFASLPEAAAAMVRMDCTIEPDPGRHARYAEQFEFYRATYEALRPLMHRMARRGQTTPDDPAAAVRPGLEPAAAV